MFQSYTSRNFLLLTVALLLLNVVLFFTITDFNDLAHEMGESGFLENIQLLYLGLAAVAFLIAGLRTDGPSRMFAIGMCVLMIVFFLRELELEPVGPISSYIESRVFRLHETIVVVGFAAIYILMRFNYVRPVAEFVLSRNAWPFYLAAAFVVTGEIFEKSDGFAYNEFFEEVFESLSYFMLLCLGIRSIQAGSKATAI